MATFINIFSVVCMAVLLLYLVSRGLNEVFGLRICPRVIGTEPNQSSDRKYPDYCVFCISLAVLWGGIFLGYVLWTGGVSGFLERVLLRLTNEGDAPRYLYIAANGYVQEGEYVNNIVFYPLYPLLLRLFSFLLGNHPIAAGMLLSQICFGCASVFFYRLSFLKCSHPNTALAAFLLYPFSFFSLGIFTEGLFLLLSISSLYFLEKEKFSLYVLSAFLCALTRTQGILLLIPALYEALRNPSKRIKNALLSLTPLLGFALYLCLNKLVLNDFLAYQYYESIEPWWQSPQWFGKTMAQQWNMGLQYAGGISNWIYWPQLSLFFIELIFLALYCRRRNSTSLVLYGTAYTGMCYTASWLISGGRYLLGCIPAFLSLGEIKNPWIRRLLLLAELYFFLIFNMFFIRGECIM